MAETSGTDEPLRIIGSSPEMHVRLEDGRAYLHPIAGTRWRGESAAEDDALAEGLLNDPKERAEHVMLVDLVETIWGGCASMAQSECRK